MQTHLKLETLSNMAILQNIHTISKCTLVGTFGGTLTNGEEHGACAFTAPWTGSAVAEDSPLFRHQVVFESLDQQVLALGVMTHKQLCIHIAHQKVASQQRQPYTLHQLTETEGCWVVSWGQFI